MIDPGPWIGIPYAPGGRDPATGLDCWGLVRAVLAATGVVVPDYAAWSGRDDDDAIADVAMTATGDPRWRPVDPPIPGDVALIRWRGLPMHAGVLVSPGHVLHVRAGTAAHVERTDGVGLRHRIQSWHRWAP